MKRDILINCRGKKSRQNVAKDLSITPQMLGMIERGDRNPSMELMKRISDYYNRSVDELFFNQNRNKVCPNSKSNQAI